MMPTEFARSLSYVIDLSDKILHVIMKITIISEFEDEIKHYHSNRLLLLFLQKKNQLLQVIVLTFGGYVPDGLRVSDQTT